MERGAGINKKSQSDMDFSNQILLDKNDITVQDNQHILHVIYGSRSGNSKAAAELAFEYARHLGLESQLLNMQEFDSSNIKYLKNILIAVSTHGEGDPPVAAEDFLSYLQSADKLNLKEQKFSVLALGDSSYKHFCKTGYDFQEILSKHGAKKICDLVECDLEFEENAKTWIKSSVKIFSDLLPSKENLEKKSFSFDLNKYQSGAEDVYMAQILEKRILNKEGSTKKTMHLSLSLKDSGINYEPGDAIGIYSFNSRRLVDDLIKALDFDPTRTIDIKDKKRMLKDALITEFELTLLTPVVVKKYAELADNTDLNKLVNDESVLEKYCETKDVLDLVTDFKSEISPEDFVSILRKLPSRLYSVASSQKKFNDEVHLTVGKIEYYQNLRNHEGVCSSFLSDRIEQGESIGIYLEKNEKFRLPEADKNIIMIGAGTGIAPYRAFMQEREAGKATGKNWLFYGDRESDKDFMYQEELEAYFNNSLLTKLSMAFSRDTAKKVYIGDEMLKNRKDFFQWIQNGAYIYLCGNKRTLAKSVREALHKLIEIEGGMSAEEAKAFVEQLKSEKRFLEDVY